MKLIYRSGHFFHCHILFSAGEEENRVHLLESYRFHIYIKFGENLIKLVRKLIKWDYQRICYIGDEMGQLLKIENIKY